mmetsp:Transcript_590/g.1017  ORF Transcript_590/g.1017 Transcript_590/m.1017 type:complete len:92 (-) Transcript_590:1899-2174(-)
MNDTSLTLWGTVVLLLNNLDITDSLSPLSLDARISRKDTVIGVGAMAINNIKHTHNGYVIVALNNALNPNNRIENKTPRMLLNIFIYPSTS